MDILLSPGAHLQWRCPCAIELQVRTGRLWLTVAGQPQDRFLAAGECVRLSSHDEVTLGSEGGQPLRLRWRAPARRREAAKQRAREGLIAALARAWRRLRYR